MSFLEKLEKVKSKKQIVDDLDYYKSLIIKNHSNEDFKSALEKVNSTITLIHEYEELFDLKKELLEFTKLKLNINSSLQKHQELYFRRYNNLLKENLTETNLEDFSKLLVMLKDEIDNKCDEFFLDALSDNINQYFRFINRVYVIVNTYKLLNYHSACQKILQLVKEIKSMNYPNIKALILSIYQRLLSKQFTKFSKQYEKLSLEQLSNELALNPDQLKSFIDLIIQSPNSVIKQFNSNTQEIIFKR